MASNSAKETLSSSLDFSLDPSPKTAASAPSSTAIPEQIWTPQKPAQPPRRSTNRNFTFSVKEVRRIALGLQKATDRSGAQSDDPLLAVQEQLGANSGSAPGIKSSKPKNFVKLPDSYEMLCEYFNCMESSIRLLRMKGSMSTFANIVASIQHLTERRFTYEHLAQLKYIMPEAIIIGKVLLHDETTCCMKPELQVTLQVDAVVMNINGKSESGYTILRKVFRERIVGFFKDHPEADEVPGEQLPHPFNQTKPSRLPNVLIDVAKPAFTFTSSISTQQQISRPSHIPQSFQRRFSQKFVNPSSVTTSLESLSKVCSKGQGHSVSVVTSTVKCTKKPSLLKKSVPVSPISMTLAKCGSPEGKTQKLLSDGNSAPMEPNHPEGTPIKLVSTPLRLMSDTPEIPTRKRCRTTSICDSPPFKRSTRTKLFMTPKKREQSGDEEYESRRFSADDDVLNILPESLLQSIREKERKAIQDEEGGVSHAIRRLKLIASLPTIFDMILLAFQSCNRSVMTKHELIHKLLANNCKIADRGELEDQVKLLSELVPEWISEKNSYSGDILCCVNKFSNPEEIRHILLEAE